MKPYKGTTKSKDCIIITFTSNTDGSKKFLP